MRRFLTLTILVLSFLRANSQSLEMSYIFNTSSEKQLDKAGGIGLMYSQHLTKRSAVGLAGACKFNHTKFETIVRSDADPRVLYFNYIDSKAKSVSIRLNYQYAVISRDQVIVSIGPELSYNFLWADDFHSGYYYSPYMGFSSITPHSDGKEKAKKYGLGVLGRVQINKILIDNLALCINARAESLVGPSYDGNPFKPYNGMLGNIEFSLGLQYRFKK